MRLGEFDLRGLGAYATAAIATIDPSRGASSSQLVAAIGAAEHPPIGHPGDELAVGGGERVGHPLDRQLERPP